VAASRWRVRPRRSRHPGRRRGGGDLSQPPPIRVARAEARRRGDVVSLFVEFDDANYRGSTYSLDFDADRSQLQGPSLQATLRQQFDVAFVRAR
jgi:hypothetical protein